MAKRIIAAKDLFLDEGKTKAVPEDSPAAAFLLIRKGREVPREYESLVTAKGNPRKPKATKEVKPGEDK